MFNFFKRKAKVREAFGSFLMERTLQNPSMTLEDALNEYIRIHSLAVRHTLDEPQKITAARTKLKIMEGWMAEDPEPQADQEIQLYMDILRTTVQHIEQLSPEVLQRMKEREL